MIAAARGLKKHLKRLNAPKHWMLDKLGGAFARKPSSGPHKARECLPLVLVLRNRLKYALVYREVIAILMQRQILVMERSGQTRPILLVSWMSSQFSKQMKNFRLSMMVRNVQFGSKSIPYLNTYDGRTIRYLDPLIRANDSIKLDLEENKIVDFIKFDVGNVMMVTGGRNRGRVESSRTGRSKHKGSFETIHIQDSQGHEFATVWVMSSSLVKELSLGCLFLRARVSSLPSLRRHVRGRQIRLKLLNLSSNFPVNIAV
ncbi:40S ribosomal protein S4 [Bienertia sinuspersici]